MSSNTSNATDPTAVVIVSVVLVLLAVAGSVYYLVFRPNAKYEKLWPVPVSTTPVSTEARLPNYLPVVSISPS